MFSPFTKTCPDKDYILGQFHCYLLIIRSLSLKNGKLFKCGLRIKQVFPLNPHSCFPSEKYAALHFGCITHQPDYIWVLPAPSLFDPDGMTVPETGIQQVIPERCIACSRCRIFQIAEDRGKHPGASPARHNRNILYNFVCLQPLMLQ